MQDEVRATVSLLRALPADGADGPCGPSLVSALRRGGLLSDVPSGPLPLMEALAAVGEVSLSAGRLFEGHVNALKLVRLFGAEALFSRDIAKGQLFGIWGADGPAPARLDGDHLRGAKLFASGADTVDRMIISVRAGDLPQLLLFRRDQLEGRLFPAEWAVSGMMATASGRCDLEGLKVADAIALGGPGDYLTEPYFQGGVWRYAAVQMGAMRALTRITADQLRARGQAEAPLQSLRLRRMLTACETARLWLTRAATEVEAPAARPETADVSILARLVVAEEAEVLMREMDHALGAASFARAHPADRIRRDLSFYLRQANPDGLSQGVMDRILADPVRSRTWGL
ncbi:acyl-CoA dehydrogenase family protein [Falsirhodobacter sp. alg1]|uniref:acyl-CoA dehydrogenase family protein n=1 Tax=Falsirhodobacter sp. alg1 TaxID=1472418 RepID=UPI000694F0C7|nr:acyl-CoA dehydrogenase family protein [Falsirhodobacter sp. alg1]